MIRKGMMVGRGKGYKNVIGRDILIHSQSAKGIKQPQILKPNIRVLLKKDRKLPKIVITHPEDVVEYVRDMKDFDREAMRIIHLNSEHKVLGVERVSLGTLNSNIVHPREIFKGAILNNAESVILIHNHPSGGQAKFSSEDDDVYNKLQKAGELLNIKLLDFVVVTKTDFSCKSKDN